MHVGLSDTEHRTHEHARQSASIYGVGYYIASGTRVKLAMCTLYNVQCIAPLRSNAAKLYPLHIYTNYKEQRTLEDVSLRM